jgi:hypothetical protein
MENSIKVGYDSKTGLYTFKPTTGYASTIEVNGKSAVDALRGIRAGELITLSEKPETITYKTTARKLIGYDNIEDMTTITLSEYQKLRQVVIDSRLYLDEDADEEDEFTYKTLEDEVFAVRFFRSYKAIYENITNVHNLEIELIEYPVSAYRNIIPLHSMDAKNVFETNCKFTPNNTELFFEICASYGIDKSRIDIPTHSGLRFVKIDDKFIGGMEDFERTSSVSIINSYETCIERMEGIKTKLTDLISFHFARQSTKIIDKSTVGHLLTELTILKNTVNDLDVKQKEHNSQRAILNRIADLLNVYKEQA